MKFIAESPESSIRKTYQRNDKIVIYVDNVIDKEKIINSITNLRQEKQELFSNSKQLPLMPKVNGFIGCVKQGKNIISTPLYDIRCTNTYNSKLSTIMEDCFICSLKQITSKNEDLAKITNCYSGNDIKPYLRAFRTMNSEQISQVVDIIKTQLIECCEKSHINIDKGNIDLNKTK